MKTIPYTSMTHGTQMEAFELAPYIITFTDNMKSFGFTALTIETYLYSIRHFGAWLNANSISPRDITHPIVVRFSTHRCLCSGWLRSTFLSQKYLQRVRRFVEYLVEIEVINEVEPPSAQPSLRWDKLGYGNWLLNERGLSQVTIKNYVRALSLILSDLGYNAQEYTATKIRRVVCEYAQHNGTCNAKRVATALRSYLKYMVIGNLCSHDLIASVPHVAQWRLSALPRYISQAEVQRIVQSCDIKQLVGLRDHAILLLLAQLGLRASDIVNLLMSDIDWDGATLLVRGKSRSVSRLPMPQEAGDAILRYLEVGRASNTACEQLFLCVSAPYRPLSGPSIVSGIVRAAIVRSGIDTPSYSGAHLLRHSAATGWLREGVSLDTVSTILRHSSADMTMHYAKIDVEALRELVVPWLGEAS